MSARTQNTGSVHIRGIDKKIKNGFKAACAKNGESMSDVIERLMKSYTHKPKPESLGKP